MADAYDLELQTASNKGFDAITGDGRQVEIKATQSNSVAFRSESEHVIAIKILPDGTFQEVYNGPGNLVWEAFAIKKFPSNGQYQISLNRLKEIGAKVSETDRLPRVVYQASPRHPADSPQTRPDPPRPAQTRPDPPRPAQSLPRGG